MLVLSAPDNAGKIICRKRCRLVICAGLKEGQVAILGYVRTLSDGESQVFDRHSEALIAAGWRECSATGHPDQPMSDPA
jgi:hypothetical protein